MQSLFRRPSGVISILEVSKSVHVFSLSSMKRHYTVAERYVFCFLVLKTIYSPAALVRKTLFYYWRISPLCSGA